MTELDLPTIRQQLEKERSNLVDQLTEMGATESGDLRPDLDMGESFADAGAVTAERTERLGVVDSLKHQLDDVDAALEKIEEGTYGICANCGNEIGAARLEARPASIHCIDCKSKLG